MKPSDIIKGYNEIVKELCDIIGDRTIELMEDFDDPYYTYIAADNNSYTIKSVFVNKYGNKDMEDSRFLHFNIYGLIEDENGIQQTYETDHTFEEIPLIYGLYLLKKLYSTLKKEEK